MIVFLAAFGFILVGALALTAAKQRSHPWNALAAELSERLELKYLPPSYGELSAVTTTDRLGTLSVSAVPHRHLLVHMKSHRVRPDRYLLDEAARADGADEADRTERDKREFSGDEYRVVHIEGPSQRGDAATAQVVFQRLHASPLCKVVPRFRVTVRDGEISLMVPGAAVGLEVTVAAIEEVRTLVLELAGASVATSTSPPTHHWCRLEPVGPALLSETSAQEGGAPQGSNALQELLRYAPGMRDALMEAAEAEGPTASAGALVNRCAQAQGAAVTDELVELLNVEQFRQQASNGLAIAGDLRAIVPLKRVVRGFHPGWVVRSAAEKAIAAIQARAGEPDGGSLGLVEVGPGSGGALEFPGAANDGDGELAVVDGDVD